MKTVAYKILILFLIAFFSVFSCKDNNRRGEIEKIVNEWMGKEILFPENVPCFVSGKETLTENCDLWFQKDFKILMYVDSAGCSSCRLNMFEWKQLMVEADSLFHGNVGFLLYFQPKNERDMAHLFARTRFDYPVFMDTKDVINRLNRFPKEMQFQCFLLDKDNKVLMIGNPARNIRIWDLYKDHIADGTKTYPASLTVATVDKTIFDYGNIRIGSSKIAVFSITNTGNYPLVINKVSASCGCTNVNWEGSRLCRVKQQLLVLRLLPTKRAISVKR